MGTFLKEFQTENQYNTYISSSGCVLPNVSLITGNNDVKYNIKPYDYFNGYEYVDLGLPSGTLWATHNIGADNNDELGYFFQWGDIAALASYENCNWDGYKYAYKEEIIKYTRIDELTTLQLLDDAANANMGGKWRIPTVEDFDELINYARYSFVGGRPYSYFLFEGNNSSLKLYTTGFLADDSGRIRGEGTVCALWTSIVGDAEIYAKYFHGYENRIPETIEVYRYSGIPIRAVIKP